MSYVHNILISDKQQSESLYKTVQKYAQSVSSIKQLAIGSRFIFTTTLNSEKQSDLLAANFKESLDNQQDLIVSAVKKDQKYSLYILADCFEDTHLDCLYTICADHAVVFLNEDKQDQCLTYSVVCNSDKVTSLRKALKLKAHASGFDVVLIKHDIYQQNRRLVVFDMDSTLIQIEVIDELAKKAGIGGQVSAITAAAMRGELDFIQSFTQRLGLLEGLSESVLDEIIESIPLMPGMPQLIKNLNALGYKTAILSGGFSYFADYLRRTYHFDYAFSNPLEIVAGKVTGKVAGPIVDGERKVALLRDLAAKEGFDLRQSVAVGDGANDLPMLNAAGLGVAFHAKPIVREQATHVISNMDLTALLYLLDVDNSDWQ